MELSHTFANAPAQHDTSTRAWLRGLQVMQTLKDLASEGKTVVCSIHQPRSSIFEMFDDLLLVRMSGGAVLKRNTTTMSTNRCHQPTRSLLARPGDPHYDPPHLAAAAERGA